MKSILFLITADPRASERPAEAVRMAAGVNVWKKVRVTIYLRDAAVLLLGEETEGLMDGENYPRYLPILEESGPPIYVQKESPLLDQIGPAQAQFEEISDAQLAQIATAHDHVLRF